MEMGYLFTCLELFGQVVTWHPADSVHLGRCPFSGLLALKGKHPCEPHILICLSSAWPQGQPIAALLDKV